MAGLSLLSQDAFRGRNDDGNETTATWKDSLNINWLQAVDTNFRTRILIGHSGLLVSLTPQLEYNLNGAGWNPVTTASSVCKAVNSTNITDGEATTQQIGAGSFVAGEVSEDGIGAAIALTGTVETEVEYVLQIVATDVVDGDIVELRVTNAGVALDVYTQTPAIVVSENPRRKAFLIT